MDDEVRSRRIDYQRGALDVTSAARDPFEQFRGWLAAALETPGVIEPNAMTLSTCGTGGRPSSRVVLLRQWDARGFVFYTNYESRKGRELADEPHAALLFWWGALERQVRIEGTAERVLAVESDAYFASRPRGHRLSAWASHQSARRPEQGELGRRDGAGRRVVSGRGSASAALGRIPDRAGPLRVLAGPAQSRPRPHRVRAP